MCRRFFVTKNRRRIAQAFRLQKKGNAGIKGSHSPQDRGRPACMRLYSTANERA
ncbi:MAG: hypothetical protein LBP59_17505 [Planctomycetaceae bacterium]|nr:hypothetical protein [Planctomycetaceae bacterium]